MMKLVSERQTMLRPVRTGRAQRDPIILVLLLRPHAAGGPLQIFAIVVFLVVVNAPGKRGL